ncbi:hypothetical protein SUGI_0034610 [Cryptomeria japonica]|nr:hypothetical protein SUGI_0034610 [Cryptomeria japonica]
MGNDLMDEKQIDTNMVNENTIFCDNPDELVEDLEDEMAEDQLDIIEDRRILQSMENALEKELTMDILEANPNGVAANAYSLTLDKIFIVMCVYGPIKINDKASTWQAILEFMEKHKKTKSIMGGDFNEILDVTEKLDGNPRTNKNMRDFGVLWRVQA